MTPTATSQHPPDRHPRERGVVLVLLARRARRRDPSATVWQLVTWDPATRTPIADVAQRWQPAGSTPGPTAGTAVPAPVAVWVTAVLGPTAAIGAPAEDYAGPGTWHITYTGDTGDTDSRDDGAAAGPGHGDGTGQEASVPM